MTATRFRTGMAVPDFVCPTLENTHFHLNAVGGRYLVLSFIGSPNKAPGSTILNFIHANRAKFDTTHLSFFAVVQEEIRAAQQPEAAPGIYFFLDYDRRISTLYGATNGEQFTPFTLVIDPLQRVLASIPITEDANAHTQQLAQILSRLPRLDSAPVGEALHAPVLIVPRIFEPEFCRELIRLYEVNGGTASGFMRHREGKTIPIMNTGFKRRKDFNFDTDEQYEPLRNAIRQRIGEHLIPQIKKAFQYEATRIERYIVAHYSAKDSGFFRAHRDNTTPGTAHRRWACTINLNAEEFEGGELRFPEFGPRSYRAPTGGAVIFSCSLLHEALPVTKGDRYAFLPFLYDDAAAKIREANKSFISDETRHEG
jgi:hypothetical protein